ncbi:restriction endonuclease subunit S [Dyadobacter fermentans]|uniref:restriction endonuclease subunit S n=1 Tax=Dyadobacter fermentans TaxID=94254 RepID=UPI001CBF0B6E|nr:restriction endonuclease subunit S [Dyadobacter fermentans]MBZ1358483.1 restriction endonuclease subunit S [Dyadobacter fermentans]
MLLGDIANIQTGILSRPEATGDYAYLQAKHFDENGKLQSVLKPELKGSRALKKHLLDPGNILFAAKGSKNFATCFEEDYPPAVASTSFFVIRLNTDAVLPKFLTWFLNSRKTQRFLKANATATSIASISKSVLEDLEIPVPTIEEQQLILQITDLQNQQKKLRHQIDMLHEKRIQQSIEKLISKSAPIH